MTSNFLPMSTNVHYFACARNYPSSCSFSANVKISNWAQLNEFGRWHISMKFTEIGRMISYIGIDGDVNTFVMCV